MKSHIIWTIGHSTRSLTAFFALLDQNKIQLLIDVRSLPGSRKFPQFNKEHLRLSLMEQDIQYLHLKELGGRRKAVGNSINTAWRNLSFRNYADYMETDEFKHGITELQSLATVQRTCIMCAEALWWRCHRSIIADYLKIKGWEVRHILSETAVTLHPYTSAANITNGILDYSVAQGSSYRALDQ